MKKVVAILLMAAMLFSLSLPALAVEFTPSVETKDAPEFVKVTDSEGNECDALVKDEAGEETPIINNSTRQIVITPYAQKGEAIVTDITGYLEGAEYQIAKAEDVSDLTDSMVDALENAKNNSTDPMVKELSLKDLVVRDLFDVSIVRDEKYIENLKEGETITFAIQTDLRPGDLFFILLNCTGEEWKVVKNLQLDENGVLTITVDSLCAIAVVVDKMAVRPVDPDGPKSPQTGDVSGNVLLTGAAVFGAAAIILAARTASARKKQTEQ